MKDVNSLTQQDIVSLIVNNNPVEVKRQIKLLTGLNADAYSNQDVIDFVLRTYNAGYDVSPMLNIPAFNVRTSLLNLGFDESQLPSINTPNGEARLGDGTTGNTWGDFLSGLAGVVTSGGLIAYMLFNHNNAPGPVNTNPAALQAQQDYLKNPTLYFVLFGNPVKKTSVYWGATAIGVLIIVIGYFKGWFKGKKTTA